MRITIPDILKAPMWVVAMVLSGTSGCATTEVIKTKTEVPHLDEAIYASCPKPSTVLIDYGVSSKEELASKPEAELDALTLKAYGNTKQDHVACYQTLINVQNAYKRLEEIVGK